MRDKVESIKKFKKILKLVKHGKCDKALDHLKKMEPVDEHLTFEEFREKQASLYGDFFDKSGNIALKQAWTWKYWLIFLVFIIIICSSLYCYYKYLTSSKEIKILKSEVASLQSQVEGAISKKTDQENKIPENKLSEKEKQRPDHNDLNTEPNESLKDHSVQTEVINFGQNIYVFKVYDNEKKEHYFIKVLQPKLRDIPLDKEKYKFFKDLYESGNNIAHHGFKFLGNKLIRNGAGTDCGPIKKEDGNDMKAEDIQHPIYFTEFSSARTIGEGDDHIWGRFKGSQDQDYWSAVYQFESGEFFIQPVDLNQ